MNSFYSRFLKSLLAPALLKAATWAARQGEGKARGDRDLAKAAPVVGLAVDAATSALTKLADKAAAQRDVQKLAGQLGIPGAGQAVLGLTMDAVDAHPTLNLSDKAALKLFLADRLLPGG